MYGTDRAQLREVFFRAWRNYREARPLEGVEKLVVETVLRHPEYHALLDAPAEQAQRDYPPALGESNPFMHLGLHIAIAEQLSIDQPTGIRDCFQQLRAKRPDTHAVEHAMMECLGEALWQAQQSGRPPDQAAYLGCLQRLARRF